MTLFCMLLTAAGALPLMMIWNAFTVGHHNDGFISTGAAQIGAARNMSAITRIQTASIVMPRAAFGVSVSAS